MYGAKIVAGPQAEEGGRGVRSASLDTIWGPE